MASLFLVYRYSAPNTRPYHGNSVSSARLAFHSAGWRNSGARKSTLAAGVAPLKLVGCASGLALKVPPVDGQAGKPSVPQPTVRVATPVLVNGLDIHTVAAAP